MTIDWPQANANSKPTRLVIDSLGAPQKKYVKSLTVNGKQISAPILLHEQLVGGGNIVFEMSDTVEEWGNNPDVVQSLLG
jgi:putative alpha-1,2-mannosidase